MNWKKITDLEGLPDGGEVLAYYGRQAGYIQSTTAETIRNGSSATHWAVVEPPKPLADSEAFDEWYQAHGKSLHHPHDAWTAALAWERSKPK